MRTVFADTSFYVALANPSDSLHQQAAELIKTLRTHILTTDFVLVEVGNYFARAGNRPLFMQLMATLRADQNTSILAADRSLWERGFDLFARRADKDWSIPTASHSLS